MAKRGPKPKEDRNRMLVALVRAAETDGVEMYETVFLKGQVNEAGEFKPNGERRTATVVVRSDGKTEVGALLQGLSPSVPTDVAHEVASEIRKVQHHYVPNEKKLRKAIDRVLVDPAATVDMKAVLPQRVRRTGAGRTKPSHEAAAKALALLGNPLHETNVGKTLARIRRRSRSDQKK